MPKFVLVIVLTFVTFNYLVGKPLFFCTV